MSGPSKFSLDEFLPARVRGVVLYDPNREPIDYDLSDNTSQWGIAPGVSESIEQASSNSGFSISRYPEIYAGSLKEALVRYFAHSDIEISPEMITIGCGTDDVLDCIVRSCTNAGEKIVNSAPSFPMAGYFGKFNEREIVKVLLNTDGSIDIDQLLSANAKLIYLCSPNNPTGLPIEKTQIETLCENFSGLVVIDEAYVDYSSTNFLDLLRFDNIAIMRTFSKLFALAGLRIGYSISNEKVAKAIEALRGPYKANAVAIEAAKASLTQLDWRRRVIAETIEERNSFMRELFDLGFAPLPSDANFVFVPMEISERLKNDFKRNQIAVRYFDDLDLYGSGIRVTISSSEVMRKVLDVLRGSKNG